MLVGGLELQLLSRLETDTVSNVDSIYLVLLLVVLLLYCIITMYDIGRPDVIPQEGLAFIAALASIHPAVLPCLAA